MLGFVRNGRRVVKIYEGSPAGKSGKIKTGDEIIAINGEHVRSKTEIIINRLQHCGPFVSLLFDGKTCDTDACKY